MKTTLIALCAVGAAMTALATPADARDGCGPGFHAGWHGRCYPNRGGRFGPPPGYGPGPGLRIGFYYNGRGYWDGNRYWQHRRWERNNWRYF